MKKYKWQMSIQELHNASMKKYKDRVNSGKQSELIQRELEYDEVTSLIRNGMNGAKPGTH